MNTIVRTAERGLLAGAIATVTMTAVIVVGRLAGLLYAIPPREITRRAEVATDIRHDLTRAEFRFSWVLAHLAFGALAGVGFAFVRGWLPRSSVAAGLIYGMAVWAFGYLGVMPALGLYPWPEDDSRTRLATMIVAHGVFGVTAAEALHPAQSTGQGN